MNINRFFIYISVLVLGITGVSGAAGISAKACSSVPVLSIAQGARSENADLRVYTPYELGCMAQYYYKRTDPNGFYPPEADCQVQKDGTYVITLYESKVDKANNPYYMTYAQYSINVNGKGQDRQSGKEMDLTLYSKVYTPEELCKLAQNYFYIVNDFYPPDASYTANEDGTYTICLFESIDDEEGTSHNATCGWYTVNVCGMGTDDLMMQSIDING